MLCLKTPMRLFKPGSRAYIPKPMDFFNRSREMEDLLGQLREKPAFNVITGPPDSGKSRLLIELKNKLLADNRPVLDINLRSVSFDSVSTFT